MSDGKGSYVDVAVAPNTLNNFVSPKPSPTQHNLTVTEHQLSKLSFLLQWSFFTRPLLFHGPTPSPPAFTSLIPFLRLFLYFFFFYRKSQSFAFKPGFIGWPVGLLYCGFRGMRLRDSEFGVSLTNPRFVLHNQIAFLPLYLQNVMLSVQKLNS